MSIEFSKLNSSDVEAYSKEPAKIITETAYRKNQIGFISSDLFKDNIDSWIERVGLDPKEMDMVEKKLIRDCAQFKSVCSIVRFPFSSEKYEEDASMLTEQVTRMVVEKDPSKKLVDCIHITNELIDTKPWYEDDEYPKEALGFIAVGLGTQLVRFANAMHRNDIAVPDEVKTLMQRGMGLPALLTFDQGYLQLGTSSPAVNFTKILISAFDEARVPPVGKI
jgi:hypothetical protein